MQGTAIRNAEAQFNNHTVRLLNSLWFYFEMDKRPELGIFTRREAFYEDISETAMAIQSIDTS